VFKPVVLAHLRQITKFSEFQGLGITPNPSSGAGGISNGKGGAVSIIGPNGFVGVLYGQVECYKSTNIYEESGTSDTVHNLLFHREAFAKAMQLKPRTQFQYKQEYLGTLATTDALWGYAEYRDEFGVDFRTDDV
jgi:hypothetical protein